MLTENIEDSTTLEVLKHSLSNFDLFMAIITLKLRTYVQAYDTYLEHIELGKLNAMKVEENREEPFHELAEK